MGLDPNGVQFLLYGKSLGVDFARSVMIGRQSLHVSPAQLRERLARFSQPSDEATLATILTQHDGYAEGFLEYLGATLVHSLDYSGFEGATHVHDMNQPIAAEFKGYYSAVIDSGTLEHVFNFPVAIKSCMEMIAVGGHYLGITPANNLFGHGFYQFSPEAYFRTFSETNGFQILAAFIYEDVGARWYAIQDPERIGKRVTMVNYRPSELAVLARKIAERPVFATMPQQSDYIKAWEEVPKGTAPRAVSAKKSLGLTAMIQKCIPTFPKVAVKKWLFSLLGIRRLEDFTEFFQPVDVAPPSLGKRRLQPPQA